MRGGTVVLVGLLLVLAGAARPAADEKKESPVSPGEPVAVPEDANDPEAEKGIAIRPVVVLDAGGHTEAVSQMLFTPDGKQLVSVSEDKSIRVWDLGSGAPVRILRPPIGDGKEGVLYAAALAPDGRTLAVAGFGYHVDGKRTTPIYLIDLATGTVKDKGVLHGHVQNVHALCLSPDGERLASAGTAGEVRVWNVKTARTEHRLKGHHGIIRALAFAPDGKRLASGGDDKTLVLWSVESGKPERVIENSENRRGEKMPVRCLGWSPDGKVVAVPGGREGNIRLWEADTGALRKTLATPQTTEFPSSLSFTPDGKGLMVTASDSVRHAVAEVLDVDSGKARSVLSPGKSRLGHVSHPLTCGALSPDGKLAAAAGTPGHAIVVWRTADGEPVHRLVNKGSVLYQVGWIDKGPTLAWRVTPMPHVKPACPFENSFNLGKLRLGQSLTPDVQEARIRQGDLTLQRSPSGHVVFVQREGQTTAMLRMPENRSVGQRTFLGEGRVAVAGNPGGLYLFETAGSKQVQNFRGFRGAIKFLAPSPDGLYLLASGDDLTLHVFRPERRLPVLSLFVAGSEWVAWTPEGYYAASPGGERLMAWQVNNGIDALGSSHPAARFRGSLYRPDVIQRLLPSGSLALALAEADKARGAGKGTVVDVEEVLPPKIALTAPGREDLKLAAPTLEVVAEAWSQGKHPVTSLQLLLDGRPYGGSRGLRQVAGAEAGGKVTEKWTVELPEGEHTLRVLARNEASSGLSNDLDVTYGKPAPKPKLFVLAVGIDTYQDRSLKLSCAVNDATELARTFQARSGSLFEVEPRVLTNERATRAGILEALAGLKKGMGPRDVAVVFYAGHGEQDGKGFYLLPQDVDANKLAATGISGEKLKEQLADLPGKVLLLLDACHSGAVGKAINEIAHDLANEDCGVVVMCAALGSEKAGEQDGHGFFCKAILEALRGENNAPKNPRDGFVYQHHLEQYVIDRVQELSKDSQHPTMAQPTIRSFALAKP